MRSKEVNREGYDSWEGFVSAGFAAEDDGGIHLAGAKGWCNVWREEGNFCIKGEAMTGKWES